nr:hypothetical protein [Tanacetum cinerariifolium]
KLFTTLRVNSPSFSGRIVPLFYTMLVHQAEGSCTQTEPHHTPFPEVKSSHPTTSSILLPSISTAPIPTVTQTDTTPIIQYSRRARIAQSSALLTIADEPSSPLRDDSQVEACPTDSGFIADQDRATIAKSSTLPRDSTPRVTSPAAEEGSMQQTINELTAFCTRLQRQHSELLAKFQSQEVEIIRLKERVKIIEDKEGVIGDRSGDDAPIKGLNDNEGEAAAERISNDSEEIASLDKSNETVAKYLQEYQQFALELPLEKKIELIGDLVKYQDHYTKVHKFQSQQRRPMSKKQKREYYMAVIKSNMGWRFKDFKGMTFKEIEAKFVQVWKWVEDFILMGSKEEAERLKRKGINLEKGKVKKQKSSEEAPETETSTEEFTEDKIKEIMQLVLVKDVYVQALQVIHPIIDWKVHSEDREDLNQLWALVEEYLSIRPALSDKEMELWVELKRMYEPDPEDQLWTLTQNYMHVPVESKLYDLSGVHHVTAKDKEIFMLVEKDYPLRRGLALVMISYRLQVENYLQMEEDLIRKIYNIANTPRKQSD